MNKVMITGTIVNDIELRQSQSGVVSTRFRIAVYRSKKDGESDSDFISCTAFGKNAEFISKYFSKGSKIGIEGNIKTGSYTDKDGKKVYTTEVWVDKSEFLERKAADQNAAPPQNPQGFVPTYQPPPPNPQGFTPTYQPQQPPPQNQQGFTPTYQPQQAPPQNQQGFVPTYQPQQGYYDLPCPDYPPPF